MAITTENTGAALIGRLKEEESGVMARIKITNATIVGGQHAPVGAILDIDAREARALFSAGKAVPHAEAPEKPMARAPEAPAKKAEKKTKKR
jgi:hypothetical protein